MDTVIRKHKIHKEDTQMADKNLVGTPHATDEYLKKMDAYWRAANYLGACWITP